MNSAGSGIGGADESILQTVSHNMNILGFGHQIQNNNKVAEDFEIPAGETWQIDFFVFFAYQTGSTTTSSINDLRFQIWKGKPNESNSKIVFGDMNNNRLSQTNFSNIYRVTETTIGNNSRPIMKNTAKAGLILEEGTYWVVWQTGGINSSGPWIPPITVSGQINTGNAMQSLNGASFLTLYDTGTNTSQGLPFQIQGQQLGKQIIPTLSQWSLFIFGLLVLNLALIFIGVRSQESGVC